jgi:hypothetical protein
MPKETVLSVVQELRNLMKGFLQQQSTKPVFIPTPRVINDRFTDNGDNTITDKQEKVTWIKDPSWLPGFDKAMTFEEAKEACEELVYAGYSSGWRMPTLKEEQSIRDYTRHEPAWDTNIFSGKYDNWYWTSTLCSWNKNAAWCVCSYDGIVDGNDKGSDVYVRPVRSCQ